MPGKAIGFSGGLVLLMGWLAGLGMFGFSPNSNGQTSRDFSVEITARIQVQPAQILLEWPSHSLSSEIKLFKKAPHAQTWEAVGSFSGNQTSYTDNNVQAETLYEYRIERKFSTAGTAYGYITAGINIPLVEDRGKVLLLIDDSKAAPLAGELSRLEQDLEGDAWQPLRLLVSKTNTPARIRDQIRSIYSQNQDLKAVIIIGAVPVPYSGDYAADGHADHRGAWPADGFYGEMDSQWTDSSVTSTNGARTVWWNVPGDGKFDHVTFPSAVELQVGRIDMSNLTCFANKTPSKSELDLLRQYLNKNHNWRHGRLDVRRKGLVFDWMGKSGPDPLSGSGYRNFSGFFGPQNVEVIGFTNYFPRTATNSYLWSMVASGGSFYYCVGVGNADEFAIFDPKVVFTMFVGSYFGDWDNESNFMRASLGTRTYTLTSSYSGIPHTPYHHFALGQTIGYGILLSQNNKDALVYPPSVTMEGKVHISLLGDPTLRMHPVQPPSNFNAVTNDGKLVLTWNPSPDPTVAGYWVYARNKFSGKFVRLTDRVITSSSYMSQNGSAEFMVKAIKVETAPSGTYTNSSQGITWKRNSPDESLVPAAPGGLTVRAESVTAATVYWVDNSGDEEGFAIERALGSQGNFEEIARVPENTTSYSDRNLTPGASYRYRIRGFNAAGFSDYTAESSVVLFNSGGNATTFAQFVAEDRTSQGKWIGKYGSDGYNLISGNISYPDYLVPPVGPVTGTYNLPNLPQALENPTGGPGISGIWHTWGSSFGFHLEFKDSRTHRVALYFVDYSGSSTRAEHIALKDGKTSKLLYETNLYAFNGGAYLIFDVAGHITVNLSVTNHYPMISGLFFDTPQEPVSAPAIYPLNGSSSTPFSATLNSMTPGAQIRYTLDGSQPTLSSPLYTSPIWIDQTTTVKARAFKDGQDASPTSTSLYSFLPPTVSPVQVLLMDTDFFTQGNWTNRFGRSAFLIPRSSGQLPNLTGTSGDSSWVWSDSTDDPRALLKNPATANRIASGYYAATEFSLDFNYTDPALLSLYFLDWDRLGRHQRVQIKDSSGQLLHQQDIQGFTNGVYLSYRVQGVFKVTVSSLNNQNAVLTGLFQDPAPGFAAPPLLPPQLASYRLRDGRLEALLRGSVGQSAIVEYTSNLSEWIPLSTNQLTETELYIDLGNFSETQRFFRLKP